MKSNIPPELVDELLQGYKKPEDITGWSAKIQHMGTI
jgi:hypothetical protein